MSMPTAKGPFHKAVLESGSTLRPGDPELAAKLAAAVVAELGLNKPRAYIAWLPGADMCHASF
jgi:carboxylesterase type B